MKDDQLTELLTAYRTTSDHDPDNMPLLPNMQPFHFGQPLISQGRYAYIGGLSNGLVQHKDGREYAEFTESESDGDGVE